MSTERSGAEDSGDVIAIARQIATAYILLEALDRRTLSSLSPALTTAQYHALVALDQQPGQSLGDLATRLLCDKANASGLMDRLAALGLATRTRDPVDARRVMLRLTAAGEKVLAQGNEERRRALSAAVSHLARSDVELAARVLTDLIEALQRAVNESAGPAT